MGLVNRDHLMVIIRRALALGTRHEDMPLVPYEDLNRNFVSAAARSLISEQQSAVLQVQYTFPYIAYFARISFLRILHQK